MNPVCNACVYGKRSLQVVSFQCAWGHMILSENTRTFKFGLSLPVSPQKGSSVFLPLQVRIGADPVHGPAGRRARQRRGSRRAVGLRVRRIGLGNLSLRRGPLGLPDIRSHAAQMGRVNA